MAMRCVESRTALGDYQFDVWLDDEKTVDGPDKTKVPDPAFVRSFTFGQLPPPSPTEEDPEALQPEDEYLKALRGEVKAVCTDILAVLEPAPIDLARGEVF